MADDQSPPPPGCVVMLLIMMVFLFISLSLASHKKPNNGKSPPFMDTGDIEMDTAELR